MEYLLTSEGMKRYEEENMREYGIASVTLMERAAFAVVQALPADIKRIAVVCGRGKNGADGLAATRILREMGRKADVFILPIGKECEEFCYQRKLLGAFSEGTVYESFAEAKNLLGTYDLLVDAIFGIGLNRPIEGEIAEVISIMNGSDAEIVSVDIPSGICADSGSELGIAVSAHETVTFGYGKPGMFLYPGKMHAGNVLIAEIGLPKTFQLDKNDYMETRSVSKQNLVPLRDADTNKGSFGKIAILAGSAQMPGAATMVVKACYRSGAGIVTLFSEESVLSVVRTTVCEAITRSDLTLDNVSTLLAKYEPIVIGPGLGRKEDTKGLVEAVCALKKTTVFDADALNVLADMVPVSNREEISERVRERLTAISELTGEKAIFTPHKLELARLLGVSMQELKEHFQEWLPIFREQKGIWVLKDAVSFVAGQGRLYLNQTGNNGMATGGSGDVLAGIIGAFSAVLEPYDAAVYGVYLHGLCGDDARNRMSETAMSAGDLLDSLVNLVRPEKYKAFL